MNGLTTTPGHSLSRHSIHAAKPMAGTARTTVHVGESVMNLLGSRGGHHAFKTSHATLIETREQEKKTLGIALRDAAQSGDRKLVWELIKQGAIVLPELHYALWLTPGSKLFQDLRN